MTSLFAQLALTAALAATGPAGVGAGIQPGPVCLPAAVHPGGSYNLGSVEVQNTGSNPEHLSLYVQKSTGRHVLHGLTVQPSWVQFSYPRGWIGLAGESSILVQPDPFTQTPIPGRLNLPATVAPGSYVAWIKVGLAEPAASGHDANLGAAAFTYLEFTVTRPGGPARRAVCITPGAKPAKPAPRAAGHGHHHSARRHHAASPAAVPQQVRVSGSEVLAVMGVILVGTGALALWRRLG